MKTYKSVGVMLMFCTWLLAAPVFGQRFGYIDSKYILEKMPEYKAAENDIEAQSKKWQTELDGMYAKVEKLFKNYEAERVLLQPDVQKKREAEIEAEEKKAKDFQKSKFGYNGELYKLREEKMKPIQDKLFKAVDDYAKEKRVDVIFDKSGGNTLIYANPDFDYSEAIIKKLGV